MRYVFVLTILVGQAAFAQIISVGVRGGVPLTGAFSDVTTTSSAGELVRDFSASNEYVIGPMVELHLPFGLSVEADALYRPLDLTQRINNGASTVQSSNLVNSWEFPVLAKYHFLPLPIVKPYVEAGPSFRATGSAASSYFSNSGFALGAGVEVKLLRLRVEPEFRYLHWGSDSSRAAIVGSAPSNVNQVEFLVGVAF